MSGRGPTSGRGRGRFSGRGRTQSTGRGSRVYSTYFNSNNKTNENKKEMKFNLRGGKTPTESYATVLDHIANHIQSTYEDVGLETAKSLRELQKYDWTKNKPVKMVSQATDATVKAEEDEINEKIVDEEIKQWVQDQKNYKSAMSKAYGLVIKNYVGAALKQRIEAEQDFDTTIKDNVIELLKRIRELTHETDESRYPYLAIIETISRFVNLRQLDDEDLITYVKRFKAQKDIVKEQLGKNFLSDFVEWTQEYKDLAGQTNEQQELKKTALEKFQAELLIRNSDKTKYGTLITTLTSQFSMNKDQYPKTLADATKVLELHKFDPAFYGKKR
jgi:hypothetical protein